MHPPTSTQAQDEVTALLHEALRSYPPINCPMPATVPEHLLPLGGYLLQIGYATPRQIEMALREQHQRAAHGILMPLGDILVAREIVHPQVLTAVLLLQLLDRAILTREWMPRLLGEHLIAMDLVTPAQLAEALQRQIWLRRAGSRTRLGELLTQQRLVDRDALAAVIETQQIGPDRRK